MKNNVYIVFFFLSATINVQQSAGAVNSSTIDRSTHLVFRRYYFISRLEKTISLLQEIIHNTHKSAAHRMLNCSEMPSFTHRLVAESAYRIQQSKSLKPILVVWDDFSSYKSLEAEIVIGKDDLFVKEFSQQLFIIAKNILREVKPVIYKKMPPCSHELADGSPEYVIDSLDYVIDLIQQEDPFLPMPHTKTNADIKMHASADEINLRFYLIYRLSPALNIVNNMHQIHELSHKSKSDIAQIQSTWTQVKQYRKIGDLEYMRNFCMLLFKVLKGAMQNSYSQSNTSPMEQIGIEDILYSIDIISDELHAVSEEYNQEKDMSFREWITKKWWIPIGTACTISLKIIQQYLEKTKNIVS